jgi:hypothetical protein
MIACEVNPITGAREQPLRFTFDCRGHYWQVLDRGLVGPLLAAPLSVIGRMSAIACVDVGLALEKTDQQR